jgi:polyhydroxybutyrate depolymerase
MRRLLFLLLALISGPANADEATHSLMHNGVDRPYIVYTPPGYNTDLSHPVIIALHGGGGNPEQFRDSNGLQEEAAKAGMVLVYPSGVPGNRLKQLRTWNAGKCCAGAVAKNSDDVGYIRQIIDNLPYDYNIDKARIYVTGHSNGAQMAYRLSCELSDRIAAIAPVAGQAVTLSCNPARAIPILHIHGTADKCATYDGAEKCGGCFAEILGQRGDNPAAGALSWPCDSVPKSLATRATLYQCAAEQTPAPAEGPVACETWRGCRDSAHVTLCSVAEAGHSWPGGSEPGLCQRNPDGQRCLKWRERSGARAEGVDAAKMIVDFFQSLK